jgi:hypothetical protein
MLGVTFRSRRSPTVWSESASGVTLFLGRVWCDIAMMTVSGLRFLMTRYPKRLRYVLIGFAVVALAAITARVSFALSRFYAHDENPGTSYPGKTTSLPYDYHDDVNLASWPTNGETSTCYEVYMHSGGGRQGSNSACAQFGANEVSSVQFFPSRSVLAGCLGASGDSEAPYVNNCYASNDY